MAPRKSKIFRGNIEEPEMIPLPSLGLNKSLGGGLLEGRIHTFWGAKASGKTTAAMHVVAEAQKKGKTCLWIDSEKTYSRRWAEACGVDTEELLVLQVNSVEEILKEVQDDFRKGEIDLIVVDSLSSIFFESYLSTPDGNPIGGFARASNFLVGKLLDTMGLKSMVILIAHQTMKNSGQMFVKSAKLSESVEHWNSTIIKFRKTGSKDEVRDDKSFKVYWTVEKSKQSVYPDTGSYFFLAGDNERGGVTIKYDNAEEATRIAIDEKIIEQGGAWLKWRDLNIQGVKNFAEMLNDDPALLEELWGEVVGLQQARS